MFSPRQILDFKEFKILITVNPQKCAHKMQILAKSKNGKNLGIASGGL